MLSTNSLFHGVIMKVYYINNLIFAPNKRKIITHNGTSNKLSQSEVFILESLIQNQGETLGKEALIKIGWPNTIVVSNSLTVAISNLRKAIGKYGAIQSTKGVGYSLSSKMKIQEKFENKDDVLDIKKDPVILDEYQCETEKSIIKYKENKKAMPYILVVILLMAIVNVVAIIFAAEWFFQSM